MIKELNVYSEIGRLKAVLLHRPGKEIESLTPDLLERLLFDDIPYLKVARKEHDGFAKILKNAGVEVYYLTNLITETLNTSEGLKDIFLDEFIDEANVRDGGLKESLVAYMKTFSTKEMIDKLIAGIRKKEVSGYDKESLTDFVGESYPFVCDPMPNLYFTRDPFATIGNGITLNHMRYETRRRETIFAKYIFKYHPKFKKLDVPYWFNREEHSCVEGGDELVISDKILAVGISQRTDAESIEKIAKKLFNANTSFETILAFDIPNSRSFMHLDTVFTMIDKDKFTIHPEIEGPLTVYKITKGIGRKIKIKKETKELSLILGEVLGRKITLIRCGGGDKIDAGREQWNDGANTLAIAPGEVVVYDRNHVTNEILEKNGVKLHKMPSSELSRGRGGPRCMSMPLVREKINLNARKASSKKKKK